VINNADKPGKIGNSELTISVSERNPAVARCRKSRAQRCTIAKVLLVPNEANHPRVCSGKALRNRGGLVSRAVVNNDEFEAVGE
jgi:hypothetical protein